METDINGFYKSITSLSRFNLELIRKVLFPLYLIIGHPQNRDTHNWSKHLMLIQYFTNVVINFPDGLLIVKFLYN